MPINNAAKVAASLEVQKKSSGKIVDNLVSQYISAHTTGIPGGWSIRFPWKGGFIEAEGNPHEVVQKVSAVLKANNAEQSPTEIATWALKHVWLPRAGQHRWKQKFKGAKPRKPTKDDKLTPTDYGHVLWGLANLVMAMPPKERPMATLEPWLGITTHIIESESVGCDECTKHMREFLASQPFNPDWSDEQQRVWLWLFHDTANGHAGNHRQDYNRIAKRWRWPALTDDEFKRIKDSLQKEPEQPSP